MNNSFIEKITSMFRSEKAAKPDISWLLPPEDVHDPLAWDKFWVDQISHQNRMVFHEIYPVTVPVIDFMWEYGMQSVLCAGNGLSLEPALLSQAGLDVVALDLSEYAMQFLRDAKLESTEIQSPFGQLPTRMGGTLRFETGDLFDECECAGPFDVIIERRTIQLFGDRQADALRALMARSSGKGCLISHWHNVVDAPDLLNSMGFEVITTDSAEDAAEQIQQSRAEGGSNSEPIWLFLTTG